MHTLHTHTHTRTHAHKHSHTHPHTHTHTHTHTQTHTALRRPRSRNHHSSLDLKLTPNPSPPPAPLQWLPTAPKASPLPLPLPPSLPRLLRSRLVESLMSSAKGQPMTRSRQLMLQLYLNSLTKEVKRWARVLLELNLVEIVRHHLPDRKRKADIINIYSLLSFMGYIDLTQRKRIHEYTPLLPYAAVLCC